MGDTFKLALQLTMIDMLSGAAAVARGNILKMGAAGKEVQRDFDLMTKHITRGLKAIAVANFGLEKLKPGVAAAAGMQEATLDVKMNLMESGQNAADLAKQLAVVRETADSIQKQMPFGSQEVMGIENVLLKNGLAMKDVTAQGGAAWAAAALATISKEAPQAMGEGLIAMASPFNLKGGQFAEIANFIQKVDQASVTTIPELVEGMKYVSGTASNMKVSWQDTLHAMGAMSQQGLRGSMAGTSLNDFLIRMVGTSRIEQRVMAALNQELKHTGKAPLEFFDAGKLKPLPAIINNLRTSLSGLTDQKRMFVLQKIFGEQGARAAFALIHEGAGSWEEVGDSIGKAADMQQKLSTRLEGFNANVKTLGGSTKTALANLFDPMLKPLTAATKMTNELVDAVGKLAKKHPTATMTGNALAAGAIAAAGVYGLVSLAKGGLAATRVFKGMKGLGGTALGIAEGLGIQAATGVQPVFVTNASDISGGGVPGIVGGAGGVASFTAIAIASIPVVAAAVMGYLSTKTGEHLADKEAEWRSIDDLKRLRKQHMILGGGADSYQVKTIDNELKRWGHDDGIWARTFDSSGGKYPAKNDIKIDIRFDDMGRPFINIGDMNTTTKVSTAKSKRGVFFDALMTTVN